jgi:hypothetical protein
MAREVDPNNWTVRETHLLWSSPSQGYADPGPVELSRGQVAECSPTLILAVPWTQITGAMSLLVT